ncbi:hypothetical protein C7999DRAFT_14372 [Corynascus novoguineensis]|uniref:Uncharacterized protein n=1 Tax=Corynascus novoguineensis TaxID=1126955 RepID=A0AAN7CSL3_9PEZI|nr:hypothetical protein C7999DRAFT_14372 [Corynascus novoguineensis]
MSAHQKELAQLTAEVKELLGQLRMQSRTRDDWGAAGSPSVVQSIERDQTQQPGRATAEWDYIFAPIRGHSDDARDHTYVPSTDLGEEEDDGAKADTDDEPRKASTEGYEHNYEKHNEEDGVVLPTVECQSASESEDAAPSAPTPQRKRKWKQEHSMRSTTTTPSPRKKKSRHVEQGKVKRAHEKGKEMKSARVPVVVLSDNEEHDETEDRQQAALAAKKKQDKKVTPVVNPYLEIIAQEQARLRALRMA